jgi:hypothetical protein
MPIRGERLRWPPRAGKRLVGTRAKLVTDEHPSPRQPNERDESADSQAGGPRPIIRKASYDDLAAGLQDTDLRNRAAEIIKKQSARRRRK